MPPKIWLNLHYRLGDVTLKNFKMAAILDIAMEQI